MYNYMNTVVEVEPENLFRNPTTPYNPEFPSTGYHYNENGSEILDTERPTEPTGWETDEEEEVPRCDLENGELSTDFYAMYREAMECCENSESVRIDVDEDMTPVTCFYTENGCPVYPEVEERESSVIEVDTSGALHILSTGEKFDGVTEAFKYLDSYFAMSEMSLESNVDPDYLPPMNVTLPDTLRRSSRFSGWTPGKYFEGDY
jgi:hypothetical protein